MKNKLTLAVVSLVAIMGVMSFVPSMVGASPVSEIRGGVNSVGGSGQSDDLGAKIKIIVNILLYILGAIAVVMIVIGGIRYTTSNGDSSAITSAKNTILYAVVGLVVAILAYALVNFILDAFK
jgi:ABC-type Fe3+ transport system permease subunit